ncbi:hypothetical protein [Halomonas alimentaria]|uniref:hypothetical protein n=1 Tax=Halomonas alimentaria TaxID=147248 RepID=UPI00248F9C80|nr:hypothetical protein [Halomonas alimentaria]
MSIRDEMPIREIQSSTTSQVSMASLILEELVQAIEFSELVGDEGEVAGLTPIQRKVWERYKAQTVQFARDMMMVSGDIGELERRAGV